MNEPSCNTCLRIRLYLFNVAVAFDRLLNALLNGNPDHTVSARLGFHQIRGSRVAHWLCGILSFIFREDAHCIKSLENHSREEK